MDSLRLFAPVYLLTSTERCYRCGSIAPVVAIAARQFVDTAGDEVEVAPQVEPILVHDVTAMPDAVLKLIHEIHPHYDKRYSKMAEKEYFMNHCPRCKAHFGDFFMFSEPDGAFFPMTDEAVAAIEIRPLVRTGTIEVEATYSAGSAADIFAKAKICPPLATTEIR